MLPFTYAVRNLFRDPARLLQTVGGSALVVFLLMAATAMNEGMDGVLSASGSPNNVILMGKGSEESIERSEVHLEVESIAATAVRGILTMLGQSAVSGEIIYQAPIEMASGKKEAGLLRGVLEKSLLVHETVRLLEGHFPGPGERPPRPRPGNAGGNHQAADGRQQDREAARSGRRPQYDGCSGPEELRKVESRESRV